MDVEKTTNEDVVRLWKERVCVPACTFDPKRDEDGPDWDHYVWEGVWVGFVLGLGRLDLANYRAYMEFGYPHELAEPTKREAV